MAKRSGKFYSKNERDVMESLGLKATKQSGAGWLEKEDGYNEHLLVQLKSTDADSYRLKLDDMRKLEYHANVEHKLAAFLVQFLEQDQTYIICKVDDIKHVSEALSNPTRNKRPKDEYLIIEEQNHSEGTSKRPKVKGNKSARDKFMKEREERWKKK